MFSFCCSVAGQSLGCGYVWGLTLVNKISTCHPSLVCLQARTSTDYTPALLSRLITKLTYVEGNNPNNIK